MTKWNFGDYPCDVNVECPELDAFLDDLDAVLKKHGVGIEFDRWDEYPKLTLVPYDGDLSMFTDHLDYGGRIPWLEDAKKRWHAAAAAYSERRKAEEEAARKAKAEAERDRALKEGVVLAGKRYKIIPA